MFNNNIEELNHEKHSKITVLKSHFTKTHVVMHLPVCFKICLAVSIKSLALATLVSLLATIILCRVDSIALV